MLTAPPICIQVSVPLTLTKRGPYAAQELLPAAPFNGGSLPETTGLSGFRLLDGSANAIEGGSTATKIARRVFRILPFIASNRSMLPDELDPDRLAAPPDHFAVSPGSRVALESQP
jgi:hypothetical protein